MPKNEQQLVAEIEKIRNAAEDSQVNVQEAVKILFEQNKADYLPSALKVRVYLISFFFPPFGLYYAVKFWFFRTEQDARKTAWICLGITIATFLLIGAVMQILVSSLPQLKQVGPEQIQELIELSQ